MEQNKSALAATNLDEINKHLPTPQQESQIAEELSELYSATNRAGAKGIKAGLGVPAVRPRGLKRASQFIDKYTPKRLSTPKSKLNAPLEQDEPANSSLRQLPEKVKIRLPRSFCADCGRTDRPHKGGAFNIVPYYQPQPGLGLDVGDLSIDYFCEECRLKAVTRDPLDDMVVDPTNGATLGDMRNFERLERIKKNRHEYIAARRTSGDMSIYDVNRNGW
jgi:hypothetical protein